MTVYKKLQMERTNKHEHLVLKIFTTPMIHPSYVIVRASIARPKASVGVLSRI